ncbi:hypothetical protein BCR37DRAFT_387644 [Protomyces lactucae-debilis]|uniref:Uncharacterized protein n=1 Tax=Protomyces lactucae-debilis TaxID=2754530 RepID=A0A1Y2FBQ8_PROLT|nr:uncharacterized protein BCR37DRAFT_387644 [Protomyces lactucae-debilis]ORY81348.1 hypothetical protein BCR37DRAFT_387644 [Protomyces lactucae-debilis]
MPSSSTAMAIFWALLLLLTNILPGSPADAHGCRQMQLTQWEARKPNKFRLTEAERSLPLYVQCFAQRVEKGDTQFGNATLWNSFTGNAAKNADQCLNLNCADCTPSKLTFGGKPLDPNDVEPIWDEKNAKCWMPTASIQLRRVHKKDIKLNQGGCRFDKLFERLKTTYGACMVNELVGSPEKCGYPYPLTIKLRNDIKHARGIEDNVKCA